MKISNSISKTKILKKIKPSIIILMMMKKKSEKENSKHKY